MEQVIVMASATLLSGIHGHNGNYTDQQIATRRVYSRKAGDRNRESIKGGQATATAATGNVKKEGPPACNERPFRIGKSD